MRTWSQVTVQVYCHFLTNMQGNKMAFLMGLSATHSRTDGQAPHSLRGEMNAGFMFLRQVAYAVGSIHTTASVFSAITPPDH